MVKSVMFEYPRVGTALAICRHGEFLFHKRKSEHANGQWAFPGGHLEKWEGLEEAVIRELREEAGNEIQITPPEVYHVENARYYDEDKHYVCVFMLSYWKSGEAIVMEPDKNEGWGWFGWHNLPEPLMKGCRAVVLKWSSGGKEILED